MLQKVIRGRAVRITVRTQSLGRRSPGRRFLRFEFRMRRSSALPQSICARVAASCLGHKLIGQPSPPSGAGRPNPDDRAAVWKCHNPVRLANRSADCSRTGIKKNGEQKTLQLRKPLRNPDQRITCHRLRQMRKHRKAHCVADIGRNIRKRERGIFDKV